jgi:hypothetical protein
MEATHTYKEFFWLRHLCSNIGFSARKITICCDILCSICLVKNPNLHAKTKHIDVQYHFVQDMVEDGKVCLEKVDTLENVVDELTKPLSIDKYRLCSISMGLYAHKSQ